METNKEWLIAGSGCVVAGLIMTLITKRQTWFCVGALTGAAVVGYRIYDSQQKALTTERPERQYLKKLLKDRPKFDTLGAPEMVSPVDLTPSEAAGLPQPVTEAETEGFPMPFRIPNAEVYIDTMDPRIMPHRTGPLGPENEPVRHW